MALNYKYSYRKGIQVPDCYKHTDMESKIHKTFYDFSTQQYFGIPIRRMSDITWTFLVLS